jgi:hypothetical protein
MFVRGRKLSVIVVSEILVLSCYSRDTNWLISLKIITSWKFKIYSTFVTNNFFDSTVFN